MAGWFDVLGVITTPISNYLNKRQEIKAQEHQNQMELLKAQGERNAELIRTGLTADMAWEQEFAKQAANSWKDEFELIVISAPLIMCFIPGLVKYVYSGFAAIDKTPGWFQFLVITIYLANYGIRFWRKTQSDT